MAAVEHQLHRVFLDVVNDDALGFDAFVALEHVEDEARALEFVFEVRRVDEDELVVTSGESTFPGRSVRSAVLVQSDFTDAARWADPGIAEWGNDIFARFTFGFLRLIQSQQK
jgi:hypothetical protein